MGNCCIQGRFVLCAEGAKQAAGVVSLSQEISRVSLVQGRALEDESWSLHLLLLCAPTPKLIHVVLKEASSGRFFRILFYENRRLQLPKCCKS